MQEENPDLDRATNGSFLEAGTFDLRLLGWAEIKRTAGQEALDRRNMAGVSSGDQGTKRRPMWMLGIEGREV